MTKLIEAEAKIRQKLNLSIEQNLPISIFYFFALNVVSAVKKGIQAGEYSQIDYIKNYLAHSFYPWIDYEKTAYSASPLKEIIFSVNDKSYGLSYNLALNAYLNVEYCAFLTNFPLEENYTLGDNPDLIQLKQKMNEINIKIQRHIIRESAFLYHFIDVFFDKSNTLWVDVLAVMPEMEQHANMIRGLSPSQQRQILGAIETTETPNVKTILEPKKMGYRISSYLFNLFQPKSVSKIIDACLKNETGLTI